MLRAFDASSLIYAWDNYPQAQFPAVWEWIAGQFGSGQLEVTEIASMEVGHKAPECTEWLRSKAVVPTAIDAAIVQEATRIKALLGITGDAYSNKGVDENDLFIIATAKVKGIGLVSEEARQASSLKQMANMKIPAVCAHYDVQVECVNFIEIIRASGIIFR